MMQSSPLTLQRSIVWLGRLVLGGIFIYAGLSKIFFPNTNLWPMFVLKFSVSMNLASFAQQVESYRLLSPSSVTFVAHTLPFAEIALGALLLVGWQLRVWGSLITLLMAGFLSVVTRAYLLHMDINCGCFATPEPLTLKTVVRDSVFTALALLMTVLAFREARQGHPWAAAEKASS